jgi:hypothetical protein
MVALDVVLVVTVMEALAVVTLVVLATALAVVVAAFVVVRWCWWRLG